MKRQLIDFAFENAALIDSEWGCCHSAEQIRTGQCDGISDRTMDAVAGVLGPLAGMYGDHPDYSAAVAAYSPMM